MKSQSTTRMILYRLVPLLVFAVLFGMPFFWSSPVSSKNKPGNIGDRNPRIFQEKRIIRSGEDDTRWESFVKVAGESVNELRSPTSRTGVTFTSVTSGSWGDPAVWGGAGVPGANDDVVIASFTNVQLDMNRAAHTLNVDFQGDLELNGHKFELTGDGAQLTWNGSIENSSATPNVFSFVGDGTPGSVTQTLISSNGGCSSSNPCNLTIKLENAVTLTTVSDAVMFNLDLTIEPSSVLDLTNGLIFIGNFSTEKLFSNAGTVRNGRLETRRLVHLDNSGTFDSALTVDSETTRAEGSFPRQVGIQSTAVLKLTGPADFQADYICSSGGTLDMNGHPVQFSGAGSRILNGGVGINSGVPQPISFVGNGIPGAVAIELSTNANLFPAGSTQMLLNSVTLELDRSTQFESVFIEADSTLDLTDGGIGLRAPGLPLDVQGNILTTNSTIEMLGTTPQSVQTDLNGAPYNNLIINNPSGVDVPGTNPLTVPGTLTLASGTLTPNSNLILGDDSTIAVSQGSLASAPQFGSSVNIRYFGFFPISSGLEVPTSDIVEDLLVDTFGSGTVTLLSDVIVNGNFVVESDAVLEGDAGRILELKGPLVENAGAVSIPDIRFNSAGIQIFDGTGPWAGGITTFNGTGTVMFQRAANFFSTTLVNNSTIDTSSLFLTFRGSDFTNLGAISGNVQTLDTIADFDAGTSGFNALFRVLSGTTTAKGNVNGRLTVQSNSANLHVAAGETLVVSGITTLNGPVSGGGTLRSSGLSVSNTAPVSVSNFELAGASQTLTGSGSFVNNTLKILGGSTTTLTFNKQLSSLSVEAGASFNFSNRTLLLSGSGNPLVNAGTVTMPNTTVEYNGSSAQNLPPDIGTYFNLSSNNPSGVSGFGGLEVTGVLNVKGGTFTSGSADLNDIQIENGATLAGTAGTSMNISGQWVNNGMYAANQNTASFDGSSQQSIGGSAESVFENLTISASSDVDLQQSIAVVGSLTLRADLDAGGNLLTMPSTGTSTGDADVIGSVRRTGFTGGGAALSFGNPFTSLSFDPVGTIPTEVTVNLSKSVPPGFSGAVERTYTISQAGGSGFSSTLRLHYLDGELNGNSEAQLKLFRFGGSWFPVGADAVDTTNNWVEKSGVSQFSQWALSSIATTGPAPFDFDGDGKTDIGVFRPPPGEWWVENSGSANVSAAQFGSASDLPVPADFTGDGRTDISFWRPDTGEWFVLRSEDSSFFAFPFGSGGDIPMPADYDGDGMADPAVFRPTTATWFILLSSNGQTVITQFGASADQPVAADYDGDGMADIAVYRTTVSANSEWWILKSTGGVDAFAFGTSTDKTVQGDWTGDGKADIAFWRPATGFWFVLRSEDQSFFAFPFGTKGDAPAPGDYDGDGVLDAAVFREQGTLWFVSLSGDGSIIRAFGATGDVPVAGSYVR